MFTFGAFDALICKNNYENDFGKYPYILSECKRFRQELITTLIWQIFIDK